MCCPERKALAQLERALDAVAQERGIDLRGHVEGPQAAADLRLGAVRGEAKLLALGAAHQHGVPALRVAEDFLDRAGKYPGMPALDGPVAPRFQHQDRCAATRAHTSPAMPAAAPTAIIQSGWNFVRQLMSAQAAVSSSAVT